MLMIKLCFNYFQEENVFMHLGIFLNKLTLVYNLYNGNNNDLKC